MIVIAVMSVLLMLFAILAEQFLGQKTVAPLYVYVLNLCFCLLIIVPSSWYFVIREPEVWTSTPFRIVLFFGSMLMYNSIAGLYKSFAALQQR